MFNITVSNRVRTEVSIGPYRVLHNSYRYLNFPTADLLEESKPSVIGLDETLTNVFALASCISQFEMQTWYEGSVHYANLAKTGIPRSHKVPPMSKTDIEQRSRDSRRRGPVRFTKTGDDDFSKGDSSS